MSHGVGVPLLYAPEKRATRNIPRLAWRRTVNACIPDRFANVPWGDAKIKELGTNGEQNGLITLVHAAGFAQVLAAMVKYNNSKRAPVLQPRHSAKRILLSRPGLQSHMRTGMAGWTARFTARLGIWSVGRFIGCLISCVARLVAKLLGG